MGNEVIVPRGIKRKYDFDVSVGDIRRYPNASVGVVLNCSKSFCYRRGLDWRFHCFLVDGVVNVVRVK
jgi:hypothetical protein